MKEETINLPKILQNPSLKKVLSSVPLQVFDQANQLIFQGGSCEGIPKIRGFPLSLSSGNIIGLIRTERKYKEAILKIIGKEIDRYFDREEVEHFKARQEIIYKDSLRLLRKGFVKDLSKLEGLIVQYLNFFRNYFLFEGVQIYLVGVDNLIFPFMEFSGDGPKFQGEEFSFDFGEMAQFVASDKEHIYIENCKDNEIIEAFFPEEKVEFKGLLAMPLNHDEEKVGAIIFTDFFKPNLNEKELEEINSFIFLLSRVFMNFKSQERQKKTDLIFKDLKKYVSKKMVEMRRDNEASVGGVEKDITVLFGQIHQFQKIYNSLGPKKMMYLLNIHYEFLIKIAESFGGNVDKVLGESLMVVWNHPFIQDEPELLAFEAAKNMIECSCHTIGPVWKRLGIKNYSFGIGINTGKAVAGNLGSKDFMDFTVIGDTVNVAQRLETKASPWEVFIHKNVAKKIKSKIGVPLKEVKGLNLKGKAEEMTAYCFTDPNLTDPFKV
ncbi:MAG: adenylate/guanylate cyclase domain-containing protein [Bdellovibrionota bacterium]|nr:adenylate/guanylate cyclase domain-containing protein [Bdellovibrionota bacterium]